MKKPKIALKTIEAHSGLSQETHAYTATVHVDGKRWGTVSNAGHGGPDDFHADAGGFSMVQNLEALVKETYPRRWVGSEYFPDGVDATLEIICQELLETSLLDKQGADKQKETRVSESKERKKRSTPVKQYKWHVAEVLSNSEEESTRLAYHLRDDLCPPNTDLAAIQAESACIEEYGQWFFVAVHEKFRNVEMPTQPVSTLI